MDRDSPTVRRGCPGAWRNGAGILLAIAMTSLAAADAPSVRTGPLQAGPSAHSGAVRDLVALWEGALLVSGGTDGQVRTWRVGAGGLAPAQALSLSPMRVLSLDAGRTAGSLLVLTGQPGDQGTYKLHRVQVAADGGLAETQVLRLPGRPTPTQAAFAPEASAHRALVADRGGGTALWDLDGGQRIATGAVPGAGSINGLAVPAAADKTAAVTTDRQGITLWQIGTGTLEQRWHDPSQDANLQAVALAPGGAWVAAGADNGLVKLWPTDHGINSSQPVTHRLTARTRGAPAVTAMAFSHHHPLLLVGTADGGLYLLALDSVAAGGSLQIQGLVLVAALRTGSDTPVRAVAFADGGRLAVIGDDSGALRTTSLEIQTPPRQ